MVVNLRDRKLVLQMVLVGPDYILLDRRDDETVVEILAPTTIQSQQIAHPYSNM